MVHRALFLLGLLFLLIGQILLAQGNDYVYSQKPIDFAHWFLLVGAILLIPQVITFPQSLFSYVGKPMTVIGIVCIVGMCVLDFIWWSFSDEAARTAFSNHISDVPSIWIPFITVGSSSKVFNLGLFILSCNYFKKEKLGVILILLATLVLMRIIPIPFRLVIGYTLTLVGFSFIILRVTSTRGSQ